MTGSTGTMRDPDSLPYTTYRISLFSAVLGSAGATLAWLFWLAIRLGDTKMLITVFVGAGVGLAVEWTRHYIKVARAEQERDALSPRPTVSRPVARIGWASAIGFLGLVAEHLFAHMAGEFLIPFLASITTLIPAGLIIGWTMSRGAEKEENLFLMVANGMMIGGAITIVTGLLWLVSFGDVQWIALFSWWGLIGIGTRMVANPSRHSMDPSDPGLAVVLIFVLTMLINLLPMTASSYRKLGPFSDIAIRVRAMAAEIELSPGLPATFWEQAEAEFKAKQNKPGAATPVAVVASKPVPDTVSRPRFIDLKGSVDRMMAPDTTGLIRARWKHWDSATWTEFIRSWIVMLVFAIGIGYAPVVERALRPVDYPNSETYRRDLVLTGIMLLVVAAACVGGRAATDSKAHPAAVR